VNQPGLVKIGEFDGEVEIARWRDDIRLFYSESKGAVVCIKSSCGEAALVNIGVCADEFIFLCDKAAGGNGEGLRIKSNGDIDIGKIYICVFDCDSRIDG
jgi:hypothetical protein